jgi:hypothetical protein
VETCVWAEGAMVTTEGLLQQGDGSLASVRDWLEQLEFRALDREKITIEVTLQEAEIKATLGNLNELDGDNTNYKSTEPQATR